MVLVATILQSHSLHKDCGGVSDRQRQVERAAHNISTTDSVHATPQHHGNSTATFGQGLAAPMQTMAQIRQKDHSFDGCQRARSHGRFNRQILRTGPDLEEFTHKCWGAHQPYTHINRKIPIDGGYKSPEIEVLNVCMLPFLDSPGDHRAFIIDISTRSLLGEFRYKVCRPISRRLIMS